MAYWPDEKIGPIRGGVVQGTSLEQAHYGIGEHSLMARDRSVVQALD